MKRRELIKAGLISAGAILTGVNVFADNLAKIIKPSPSVDMSKKHFCVFRFNGHKDINSLIEQCLNHAVSMLGNNVNLDFIYIPAELRDKDDPLGQRTTIGWSYMPEHQNGKSSRNVYPSGSWHYGKPSKESDFYNSPIFEKLHQEWNKTRYIF